MCEVKNNLTKMTSYRGTTPWNLVRECQSFGNIREDYFSPEDEGSKLLRNVGTKLQNSRLSNAKSCNFDAHRHKSANLTLY